MTRRYLSSASKPHPSVATDEYQYDAEMILSFLNQIGSPQCSTNAEVRPFLCLHFFGLCDVDTGESYRPCASQCMSMRHNICADDWKRLATSSFSLPDCNDPELFDIVNLICDEQEIQRGKNELSNSLFLPYVTGWYALHRNFIGLWQS